MRIFTAAIIVAVGLSGCNVVVAPNGVQPNTPNVQVYKFFGTVQCEPSSITLTSVTDPLRKAGIKVASESCGTDGMMRPAVCGGGDGRIAIAEIASKDLAKAASLGFEELSKKTDAQIIKCR